MKLTPYNRESHAVAWNESDSGKQMPKPQSANDKASIYVNTYYTLEELKRSRRNKQILESLPVWPAENRQMSIKVAQKWFH